MCKELVRAGMGDGDIYSMPREASIYNRKKTASSINNVAKLDSYI